MGPGDFKDRLGAVRVYDVKGIGGVIDNDRSVTTGKGHELRQLRSGRGSACIVRKTSLEYSRLETNIKAQHTAMQYSVPWEKHKTMLVRHPSMTAYESTVQCSAELN